MSRRRRKVKRPQAPKGLKVFTKELSDMGLLYPTGHENAIMGICERACGEPVLAIDGEMVLRNLMADGMSREDAVEYYG